MHRRIGFLPFRADEYVSMVFFLSYHEVNWLGECYNDDTFWFAIFYRRYVDDTFLLSRAHSHIELFFDYLNSKYDRIRFTCEIEAYNKLSFLNIVIYERNESFSTSTYMRPTLTGLGTKYFTRVLVTTRRVFLSIAAYLLDLVCIIQNLKKICIYL